uniref:Uncharacterized protein n=1 Tax=Anguilla anguilla TaxID=7936 RepID=A0A0E9TID8_ANGAN
MIGRAWQWEDQLGITLLKEIQWKHRSQVLIL